MGINIQKVKNIIWLVLPPLFVKVYRLFVTNEKLRANLFEGVYQSLLDIKNATDYDSRESSCNTYIGTIEKFKDFQHEKVLPKSEIRSQICNLLPMLVATFLDKQNEITILDWGGGMGTSYINCLNSINCTNIKYYVVDLMENIELGRKIFPKEYNIHFLENISALKKVDIVYVGSALQYIPNYRALLIELINKAPKYILLTDHFMGGAKTYATAQINMPGRRIAYWIFELKEIIQLFKEHNYNLIYRSVNYQPFHDFNNFPEYYRVDDSCNLLFSKKTE